MLEKLRGTKTRFRFFGGKGGVGKTSLSAATALKLAERGNRTLIISTDPAHSVSDVFDTSTEGETRIRENLFALEIDPERAAEEYREKISAVDEVPGLMQGMDMVSRSPGMDEMAAFDEFMKYMESGEYDYIVFDTAPTGHTLNLLQLPEIMDSMVGKVLKLRMRLSGAIDMVKGMFGGEQEDEEDRGVEGLRRMKKRIETARALLADRKRTRFNFVLIPEKMSIYETERALEAVGGYGIAVGGLYVNKVLPENPECEFCTARNEMQSGNLEDARRRFGEYEITEIPLFQDEVRGLEMLGELSSRL